MNETLPSTDEVQNGRPSQGALQAPPFSAADSLVTSGSTLRARNADTLRTASQLAAQIKAHWRANQKADAQEAFARHPELQQAKSVAVDLALEEYCLRTKAGEELDFYQFCLRFPKYQNSLMRTIAVQRSFREAGAVGEPGEAKSTDGWPQPADQLLGFDLIDELGRGSFARVYLAAEIALGNRLVALKLSRRAAVEAQTHGKLKHENIVPIHSVQYVPQWDLSAICMEYLGHATLCEVLDYAYGQGHRPARAKIILEAIRKVTPEGLLPASHEPPDPVFERGSFVEGVLHLIVPLARALAHTHTKEVLHLDLKPSNVLITPAGRPMLLDFNLSYDAHVRGGEQGGTLPYMSPEQLRDALPDVGLPTNGVNSDFKFEISNLKSHLSQISNLKSHLSQISNLKSHLSQISNLKSQISTPALQPIDARSDVFSLGVILYELLTGVLPFGPFRWSLSPEKVARELLQRQSGGPQPLREIKCRVSRGLARVVERSLAFDPAQRYQTAGEFAAALSDFSRQSNLRSRRRKFLVGSLALAVGGASAFAAASRESQSKLDYRAGKEHYRQAQYDQALQCYNRALDLEPDNWNFRFARGRALQKLGQFEMSLIEFEKAPEEHKNSGIVLAGTAYCWGKLDYPQQAAELYIRAQNAGFANSALFQNLGYAFYRQYRLANAQASFESAVASNSTSAAAHEGLAMIDLRRADQNPGYVPRTGLTHIEEALRHGPHTGELLLRAALLSTKVGQADPTQFQVALDRLEAAVQHGLESRAILREPAFKVFAGNARFEQICSSSTQHPELLESQMQFDPLDD